MIKPNLSLRLARMEAGLTQEELAEELDVSGMSVYRWESGQRIPHQFQRLRLCAFFGKSEGELGWPTPTEEEPRKIHRPAFFDPAAPLGRSMLAGQQTILKAIQAHCLVPPAGRPLGLVGLAGSGKTALAATLLAHPKISHFGVLWATIGQRATPLSHLVRWAHLLGQPVPPDVESAKEAIRMAIGTQRVLIVLDDVWNSEDLFSFQVGGPGCQYVITTRQPALAFNVCDVIYRPAPLTAVQALHFLSSALPPVYAHEYRTYLQAIVQELGGLPLALELARGYLRREASSHSQRRIHTAVSQLTHPNCYLHQGSQRSVFVAIRRSEQWISETARKALFCLATHYASAPATFSEQQALEIIQNLDLQAQDLDCLLDSGLVDVAGESRYQIHPVIAAYVRYCCSFSEAS